MNNWNARLSEVGFLNKEDELKKASFEDSIVSIDLNFKRNRNINNLLIVRDGNKPVGIINKKQFIDCKSLGVFDSYSKPIKEFADVFELIVDENSEYHDTISSSSCLKDALLKFSEKRCNKAEGNEYYPESIIITDNAGKLYSIISYKDILKQIGNDPELNSKFKTLKEAEYRNEKGTFKLFLKKGKDMKRITLESTYDDARSIFIEGHRTVPILVDDKFIGFVVSHISHSNDMKKNIDEKHIFYADAFKNTFVSLNDPLSRITEAFRTQPYFSSLAIFNKNNDFEAVVSYTEVFKWCNFILAMPEKSIEKLKAE